MKKIRFYALALAAISMGAVSCSNGNNADGATETGEEVETVNAVSQTIDSVSSPAEKAPIGVVSLDNDDLFRPGKKVDHVTVLDFNAVWCVPCKKLTPAYEAAAKDYDGNVAFYSVDFEKNVETAKAFKINSVPSVIIIAPNGSFDRYDGLDSFISPDEQKEATKEAMTKIITASLKEKIDKALK